MLRIDTPRLVAVPLSECDQDLYCRLFTDPETMRHIGTPLVPDAAVRSFRAALALTACQPAVRSFFSVSRGGSDRKIGICSIQQRDPSRPKAEVGIMLEESSRAQGLSTELLAALVGRAFTSLAVDEVYVEFSAAHRAAERLSARVGFVPSGQPVGTTSSFDKHVWCIRRDGWRPHH